MKSIADGMNMINDGDIDGNLHHWLKTFIDEMFPYFPINCMVF